MINHILSEVSRPLSGREIIDKLDGRTNIIKYDDLPEYDSLDEILYPYNCAVILYNKPGDNYGHWTCIFRRDNGELEFFDPYGHKLDDKKLLRGQPPYLSKMILEDPTIDHIIWNEHKFQKLHKGIQTCGRHCLLRILLKDLNLQNYYDTIYKGSGITDSIVTALTL